MKRYGKFEFHDRMGYRYSARTIGAVKRFIKKHNIDTHGEYNFIHMYEDYNDDNYSKRISLFEFMDSTGYKNAPIMQKEFSRDYRHSRYVNVGY